MKATKISEGVYSLDNNIIAVNPAYVSTMTSEELDNYLRSLISECTKPKHDP
jgi:hypothetical protein